MAENQQAIPLQTSNNANIQPPKKTLMNNTKINSRPKSIEEIYQKRSQTEHILLRPDTYIGSNNKHSQTLWIYDEATRSMVNRGINYVPGLYKIFDEILVNAADNKQRDPSMNLLRVDIDVENGRISVFNNGEGIPIVVHKTEKIYVPEMIFGHLLTSSNYDDGVKKTTGGRNGYGAKLTNIFSTEFVVETADAKRKKNYKQVFTNNMRKISKPIITTCKTGESWTKVSFKPDLAKFGMRCLEDDVVALMKKRVVDLAGCLGETVKVELNGQQVPVNSFLDYVNLYIQPKDPTQPSIPRFVEKPNDRWEICVCVREGRYEQVSFVNGIATIKGGTHVEAINYQIINYVANKVEAAKPNSYITDHSVKNHLWVFVNALIDNPSFSSQTKMTLTTDYYDFGSDCNLSEDFLNKLCEAGIVESLVSYSEYRLKRQQKKADQEKRRRIPGIPKLEDANEAGGEDSDKCTLILTEGDSAKALAMAGISAVGRNHYGVFPLKGKMLNVREANEYQICQNKEIQDITKILGLEREKQYESVESLRYGHLMIMTDQDHDGSHIKGLLINFIHSLWPDLLKIPSFLVEFITPIVKATNKNGCVVSFYSMPEYEMWKESLGENTSGWSIKYYKGLGTSTSMEGKSYFQELEKHKKDFVWVDHEDGEAIELAFSRHKIDARKNWLLQYKPGTYLDQKEKYIKYRDFVNKELIQYSIADLHRSIPSMVDGLKIGQRKILFSAFKRNFIKEAKVAQFTGYVSEHSAYHHGEQGLATTIVGMAQDFVGSNNINLLQPNGQFGTRHQGGKDHAHARYIFTCLSRITRFLFPKNDDILLSYLNEEGQCIEPTWYIPIIPMVLVNGCEGIGTGWSTNIPNYNPKDIIVNVKRLLNEEAMVPMDPWYKGFKGTIEKTDERSYTISGIIEEVNKTTLGIRELPIKKQTEEYKVFLDSLAKKSGRTLELAIKDFKEYNDDKNVNFEIILSEKCLSMAKKEGLLKSFKLTTTISTNNMHLFDPKGVLKKYATPEEILEEFFHLRLKYYEKRKIAMLQHHESELLKMENKLRFIYAVINGEILLLNRKRADLFFELKHKGFTPFPKNKAETALVGEENDYDYLLSMPVGTLTMEKVQELCVQRDRLNKEVDILRNATPKTLWLKDLDSLEKELGFTYDPKEEANINMDLKSKATNGCTTRNSRKGTQNRRKSSKKADKAELGNMQKADKAEPMVDPIAPSNTNSPLNQSAATETMVENDSGIEAAAQLKNAIIEISDSEEDKVLEVISEEEAIIDEYVESQIEAALDWAMNKLEDSTYGDENVDPNSLTRKRGKENEATLVTQDPIIDIAKAAESTAVSPEKKVRKMTTSPFSKSKKSGRANSAGKIERKLGLNLALR